MVLLAASICTKQGKAIVSRQFVEMTRSRIEGLIAAFPKLIGSGKQHTYIDTESVRYVYQPLEKLYVLLITTKASNILEDLETLRLFAKVIPEYCKGNSEKDIIDNSFQLIFAFDEIVALGYRENVNLSQIRTFTEMDSHEERAYEAQRETQEREAKDNMKKRARELELQRREAAKRGIKPGGSGGFGSSDSYYNQGGGGSVITSSMTSTSDGPSSQHGGSFNSTVASTRQLIKPSGSGKAMKLGSKAKDVDSFVTQLKAEGERVADSIDSRRTSITSAGSSVVSSGGASSVRRGGDTDPGTREEPLHIKLDEKLTLQAGRDGGLNNMELLGICLVKISKSEMSQSCIKVITDGVTERNGIIQTHPNIDKQKFLQTGWVQLKNPDKPFPLGQEVGVLKWRIQTTDESQMPLTINCWPTESGAGFDVTTEYELQQSHLQLSDVCITIPLPPGSQQPRVSSCEDGDYRWDSKKSRLEWLLPCVGSGNKSGSLEFSVTSSTSGASAASFFPVEVYFNSRKSYCGVKVDSASDRPDSHNDGTKFSCDTLFSTEKYEFI